MNVATLSLLAALLALCCLAGVLALALVVLLRRLNIFPEWLELLWSDLGRASLGLALVVSVTAMAGSLYYSEHMGYVPCKLCWYQRICMYSLAVILTVATIRRDRGVRFYAVPLAGIGAVVAAYHSWVQAYPPDGGTSFCTTDASCTARYVWEFGFVSLPFMALCGFLFVLAMMFVARDTDFDDDVEIDDVEIDDGQDAAVSV